MPGRYATEFLGHDLCGADVITSRFSRPHGYAFAPGQWFTLALETAEGRQSRTFSHCSAPGDAYLELTTRLSGSAYKNALLALEPGTSAEIAGPARSTSASFEPSR